MSISVKDKIRILFILLFLAMTWDSYGQAENLRFYKIGFEEGLSNDNVTAMLQDRKGYTWFGSQRGLNKYDGYTFTQYRFDPFDSNSISQNLIYNIFEDHDGVIWVTTFEGLCKFDLATEKFSCYRPSSTAKFNNPNIWSIGEDSEGTLWVGSLGSGLCRFNRQTGQFLPDTFDLGHLTLPGWEDIDGVNCIYKDRAGVLWVANLTGLHQINLSAVKAGHSRISRNYKHDPHDSTTLSSDNINSIFEDRAGILWMTTDKGLNSFDKKTGRFKRYQNDPKNVKSISSNASFAWGGHGIQEDKQGNLWIGTDKGLNRLNKERTEFTAYVHNPNDPFSIGNNDINNILIDTAGVLWASSSLGKLNKVNLKDKGFRLRQNDPSNINSLSSNEVTSIAEDSSGIIWIGTSKGLNRWDKTTNQFTKYTSSSY